MPGVIVAFGAPNGRPSLCGARHTEFVPVRVTRGAPAVRGGAGCANLVSRKLPNPTAACRSSARATSPRHTTASRLSILTEGARHYLREPLAEPVQEEWWGWRPMTFDGLPIIDRAPAAGNVLIAAGHNMLGLSMATATGKLVAEMTGGAKPHIDPMPYSLRRFG